MKTVRFAVFILVLALALSATAPAGASSSTIIVKPTSLNGWFASDDGLPGGTATFANGPSTTPLGTGSLNLTLSGSARMLFGTLDYAGTRLSDLTHLEYSTYRASADAGNLLAITMQFDMDYDLTDSTTTWQSRLVFEPYFTAGSGNIPQNTWQTWTPMSGKWWIAGTPIVGDTPVANTCPQAAPRSWPTVLAAFPNAGLREGIGVLWFKAGGPWTAFNGNVDAFTIGVSNINTTYDFEPEPPCTNVCYVDAANGSDAHGGASIGDAKKTIQAAIDAVNPGGQVRVLPGIYDETATGRFVLGANGPHQFGLFIAKDGVTLQGVNASDVPLTDYNALGAYVTTNATNNFGTSGIFVEGDNVTLAGLHIGPNIPGDNKTIEVIGDRFTLRDSYVDVPGGGSIYFGDWQFNNGTNTSHIQSYTIDHNLFDQSTSIDFASGAGYSGPVSERQILHNEFVNSEYWPSISFNGSGTGVPWFVQPVGGAVIQGNTFSNTFDGNDVRAAHIRVRGTVDSNQFDWASYWSGNTFNKAVVTLESAPFHVRQYNYTSGSYSFDTRRIGVNIQSGVNTAEAGDTVLVKDGIYVEQVVVGKSLTLLGESGADFTVIKAPATIPVASNAESNIVKIAGAGVQVEMSGFTVAGPGPSGCGSIGTGIFVRDDAYASIHDNKILNVRDSTFSGCQNGVAIMVGRALLNTNGSADITDNIISGYQKNGITVSNSGSWAIVENNQITGAGPTSTIAQNGVQFSGGAMGEVNENIISGHSYSPGSYTSTGMLLFGADVDTFGNTLLENQVGVYHIDGSGIHEANLLTVSSAGTISPYFYGFIVDAPPPGLNPQPFEDHELVASAPLTMLALSSTSVQDVDLLNNELLGDSTSAGIGIGAYGGFGSKDIDLTIKNNKIANFGIGLDIYQCTGSGCTANVFHQVDVNLNSITGSVDYGLINTDAIPVDAETNWWSSNLPAAVAAQVSGDADYTPWLCSGSDTSADPGFQPSLVTLCPYQFTGFFQPIDMNATNIAKAGQTIPVKWRLTDANGVPISDPAVFAGLVSYSVSCTSFTGALPDVIETYTGSSGLQYLGDGYWQFNWKTPKSYGGSCRKMYIQFQGGLNSPEVNFQFK